MHEMSLVESVREIIEDAAAKQGFSRVKTVWLEIGQLACVEAEALRFSFDAVMRDSIAQGARLEVVELPGEGWCERCACDVAMLVLHEACPNCGECKLVVTGGDQMRVRELEVE